MPYKGCGYKNVNKTPWNKSKTEYDDVRVKNQANSLRKNRYNKWEANKYNRAPNGEVILEETPRMYRKFRKDYCEICDRNNCKLEVHHKDGNHNNFNESNFITVCPKCHQGVENKNLEILYADKIVSIEEVGFIEVYDIEMNSDFHNYSANGIIVHNCNYDKDKFDNEIKFIEPIFYDNSWIEANYEGEAFSDSQIKSKIWYDSMSDVEDMYMNMSKTGSKPDELRMLLPHSTAAQVYMTANIREWRHILRLRCSKMTHPAIQQVLIPLLLKFKQDMPELFEDVEYNTEFPKDKYAELKIMEEV